MNKKRPDQRRGCPECFEAWDECVCHASEGAWDDYTNGTL